jgi:hypothetical protein
VKNPQYKFDPDTVGPLLVGIPDKAIKEMEEFDKEFMPNVPSWGNDTPDPRDDPLEDAADKELFPGPEFFFFSFFFFKIFVTCKRFYKSLVDLSISSFLPCGVTSCNDCI